MKKRRIWFGVCLVLAIVLLCAGIGGALELPERVRAVVQLKHLLERSDLALSLTLDTPEGQWRGSAFRNTLGGDGYYGLEVEGFRLYIHEEAVYFDNGRGYDLEDVLPDADTDWEDGLWALLLTEYKHTGDSHSFSVTEQTVDIMGRFLPELGGYITKLRGASLELKQQDGQIPSIRLVLPEGYSLSAVPDEGKAGTIPTEVLMVMKAEQAMPVRRVLPLLRGCAALAGRDVLGAQAKLALECGPLPIQDTAQLYLTDGGAWFVRGERSYALRLDGLEKPELLLLGLGVGLLREATLETDGAGNDVYTLDTGAEAVATLFDQLLPEAANLNIAFDSAQCRVVVAQDRIRSVDLSCTGQMPFLITYLPIGFSVELELMEGAVALPDGLE